MKIIFANSVSRTEEADSVRIRTLDVAGMADIVGGNQIVRSSDVNAAFDCVRNAVIGHRVVIRRRCEIDSGGSGVVDVVIRDLVVASIQVDAGSVRPIRPTRS